MTPLQAIARITLATAILMTACPLLAQTAPPVSEPGPRNPDPGTFPAPLTLERIMSDTDWLARSPERPFWSDDCKSIFYSQKRLGDDRRDLIRIDVSTGQSRVVTPDELPSVDVRFGSYSKDRTRKLYSRAGDLYLKDLSTGALRQLTRTGDGEHSPDFLVGDDRFAFQRGAQTYVREIASGLEYQVADLRAENKPEDKKDKTDYLKEQQERLFEFVRKNKASREAAKKETKEEAQADTQRVARPWYLGDDKEIRETSLSPTGEVLLVQLAKKSPRDSRNDTMPAYVTEDGYVSSRSVRSKVGTSPRTGEELVLLDLKGRPWKDDKPPTDPMPPAKDSTEPNAGDKSKPLDGAAKQADGVAAVTPPKKPLGDDGIYRIDLAALPDIATDPLKSVREQAEAWKKAKEPPTKPAEPVAVVAAPVPPPVRDNTKPTPTQPDQTKSDQLRPDQPKPDQAKPAPDQPAKEPKKPDEAKPRPVSINQILWSDDGRHAIVQVYSLDNKDRWIAEVVLSGEGADATGGMGTLKPLEHFHDDAWINGQFADLGWLPDGRTIWFLSEESGYSQIYFRDLVDSSRWPLLPRSEGGAGQPFEVLSALLNRAGDMLYFTASLPGRPGVKEGYRALVGPAQLDARRAMKEKGSDIGFPVQQLTELGGVNELFPSPDDRAAVVLHSTTTRPPELLMQPITSQIASGGAHAYGPRALTTTVTPEFKSIPWIEPQVLPIPGRNGRQVWSRVYDTPQQGGLSSEEVAKLEKRPAVLFIHGAGYLQNAHEGWSYYFREFMFHTLLVERGYVVLDMDFRASAGYGRDWRTAIYRNMGYPELEDLEDGVAWLVNERNVDPARVGCYGGSYGGFLTLMAMFTKPDLFKCGAALRPVTDWAHYNDGYTSNILNVPGIDPEPYEKCAPIEHAAGLKGHLLICHGMLDDNVLFEDTVRLSQRLIELKKENWEVAMYPIEPHAFKEATSWLDEYRRIDKLFRTHLGK